MNHRIAIRRIKLYYDRLTVCSFFNNKSCNPEQNSKYSMVIPVRIFFMSTSSNFSFWQY